MTCVNVFVSAGITFEMIQQMYVLKQPNTKLAYKVLEAVEPQKSVCIN